MSTWPRVLPEGAQVSARSSGRGYSRKTADTFLEVAGSHAEQGKTAGTSQPPSGSLALSGADQETGPRAVWSHYNIICIAVSPPPFLAGAAEKMAYVSMCSGWREEVRAGTQGVWQRALRRGETTETPKHTTQQSAGCYHPWCRPLLSVWGLGPSLRKHEARGRVHWPQDTCTALLWPKPRLQDTDDPL